MIISTPRAGRRPKAGEFLQRLSFLPAMAQDRSPHCFHQPITCPAPAGCYNEFQLAHVGNPCALLSCRAKRRAIPKPRGFQQTEPGLKLPSLADSVLSIKMQRPIAEFCCQNLLYVFVGACSCKGFNYPACIGLGGRAACLLTVPRPPDQSHTLFRLMQKTSPTLSSITV